MVILEHQKNRHLLYLLQWSTPKSRKRTATPLFIMCSSQNNPLYLRTTPRIDWILSRIDCLLSRVLSTPVLCPTHPQYLPSVSWIQKRRQLELIVQRCCSTEHALHYNNCRLNVSETNAFQKTCLNTLHSAWNFSERVSASRMSNDRKRRLDVDGSGSGSKKHR